MHTHEACAHTADACKAGRRMVGTGKDMLSRLVCMHIRKTACSTLRGGTYQSQDGPRTAHQAPTCTTQATSTRNSRRACMHIRTQQQHIMTHAAPVSLIPHDTTRAFIHAALNDQVVMLCMSCNWVCYGCICEPQLMQIGMFDNTHSPLHPCCACTNPSTNPYY